MQPVTDIEQHPDFINRPKLSPNSYLISKSSVTDITFYKQTMVNTRCEGKQGLGSNHSIPHCYLQEEYKVL